MVSPLYVAVILFVPVDVNVTDNVAVPAAGAEVVGGVPTSGEVPRVVPAEVNVTVPVGAAPLLPVVMLADKIAG